MRQIIMNIRKVLFFAMLLLGLVSCNKEKEFTRAIDIQIRGYNIGNAELEVSIDEVAYDKFKIQPNRLVDFGKVHTYPSHQNQALLKVKDIISGKEVLHQQLSLNNNELEMFFPLVLINGSLLEIKPPASDPSTNRMAFYIYYPESNDTIDIFLKDKDGKISYLAKNVQPSKWGYVDYLTAKEFDDPQNTLWLYFTKAGTTDQWAFKDSEQMSKSPVGTLLLPAFAEKGRVCTYFVTPGSNQLDVVRLFKGTK